MPEGYVAPPVSRTPSRLLSYNSANLQGIGTRSEQQDGFSFVNAIDVRKIRDYGLLAIVADGMGGMNGGKLAAEMAIDSIRSSFDQIDYDKDLGEQLKKAVLAANERVNERLDGEGGTTAVICLFYREKLYYASVGDSYLYLLRGGTLYRINRPHTVYSMECERQILRDEIDPSVAADHPKREAVASFIGINEMQEIDRFVRPMKLLNGDTIMLCSDGVAGVLDIQQMTKCLSQPTPQLMCKALESCIIAASRKHQDNYTALVIRCEY